MRLSFGPTAWSYSATSFSCLSEMSRDFPPFSRRLVCEFLLVLLDLRGASEVLSGQKG